jgi:pyruvate/2-oxoglutarate dehydrogenase complex dihydrolipoamide dehydrogenase (E3) component
VRGRYDLVVLGGGTAGIVASTYAAGLGARVALVERELPGGDCLFTGCIPSKSLLAAAGLAHAMRTASRLGLDPVEPRVDLAQVMDHVQRAIAEAGRPDTPKALEGRGIELVRGSGRFTGPGRIEADGRELRWRAAVLATGSEPALPPVPGLADAQPLTTDTVWSLRELPDRLAVLGGGPTGVELGQAFARLGSQVTIVEASETLLPALDRAAGDLLAAVLREEGVQVRTGCRVQAVDGGRLTLVAADATRPVADATRPVADATRPGADATRPGATEGIRFDSLLVAAGRRPCTSELGLDSVSVELDERGFVRADRRLRTSGDRIWAAGDVLGGLQFTHVAGHQGAAAALNALLRARRSYSARAIPRVVFTDPEIAAVGLGVEEAARDLGREHVLLRHDYSESDRAITEARARGFAQLVCDPRGRLLGALVVAPGAGEYAAELGRMVREREKVSELARTVHPYPTYAEGPARAAESWFWRSYLTPRNRRLLRPLLRALRNIDRPRP